MPISRMPTPHPTSGVDEIRSACSPDGERWRARFEFLKAGRVVIRTFAVRDVKVDAIAEAASRGFWATSNPSSAFDISTELDGVSVRSPSPEPEILE